MGKLKQFDIVFPAPRVFHVGDRVVGKVAVSLSEPMKIRSKYGSDIVK